MDAINFDINHLTKMFLDELADWELGHPVDENKIKEMKFICKLMLYNEHIIRNNVSLI